MFTFLSIWYAVKCPLFLPLWYFHFIRMNSHHEQVVLYEDELADNGVSLLTVKVVNNDLFSSVDRELIFCCANYYVFQWLMMSLFGFVESHAKFLVSSLAILGELLALHILNFIKFFKWSYAKRIAYYVVIILIFDFVIVYHK